MTTKKNGKHRKHKTIPKRGGVELPDEIKDILNDDVLGVVKSFDYELAGFEFDNASLRQVVNEYCNEETHEATKKKYGPIGEWDVRRVTDMTVLFGKYEYV